jgi:hypothetical protein
MWRRSLPHTCQKNVLSWLSQSTWAHFWLCVLADGNAVLQRLWRGWMYASCDDDVMASPAAAPIPLSAPSVVPAAFSHPASGPCSSLIGSVRKSCCTWASSHGMHIRTADLCSTSASKDVYTSMYDSKDAYMTLVPWCKPCCMLLSSAKVHFKQTHARPSITVAALNMETR